MIKEISIALLLCFLVGCGEKTEVETLSPSQWAEDNRPTKTEVEIPEAPVETMPDLVLEKPLAPIGDTVDLTVLSSTMVFAEVYNIMVNPQDYQGKTIKMDGQFWSYLAEDTGMLYLGCLIMDATACCQQGIEFVLADESVSYPEDYPAEGTNITVEGEFRIYQENGTMFCHLVDATMVVDQ